MPLLVERMLFWMRTEKPRRRVNIGLDLKRLIVSANCLILVKYSLLLFTIVPKFFFSIVPFFSL